MMKHTPKQHIRKHLSHSHQLRPTKAQFCQNSLCRADGGNDLTVTSGCWQCWLPRTSSCGGNHNIWKKLYIIGAQIISDHISKSSSHPSLSKCFCLFFLLPMSCALRDELRGRTKWPMAYSTGAKALNAPGEFDQVDLPRPAAPRKASRGKTPWRESYIKMSYNHHRI